MNTAVGKLAIPTALTLLLAWRIHAGLIAPDFPTRNAIPTPKDPVVATDLPAAMSFPWVRPLFAKTVPLKPLSANSQPQAEERSDQPLRLVGIVLDGESRVALVAAKDRLVRSQTGSIIGQWTIEKIENRSVTLKNRGEIKILILDQK